MEEIRSIIKEYMEVISDPNTSDHAKVMAKIHAFDDILREVEWYEQNKKGMKKKEGANNDN